MNKLLFLGVISILSTTLLLGQQGDNKLRIEKGTWYTSGNISFTNFANNSERPDNISNQESFGLNLAPKLGYTVKNNLVVGIGMGYSRRKSDGTNTNNGVLEESESLNQSINIAPFLRAYKGLGANLALFLQGEFGYSRIWFSNMGTNQSEFTSTQNQYFISIRPGLTYFMSKKLALETTIGNLTYRKFDSEQSDTDTSSGSNFNLSVDSADLFIGIAYYF